MNNSGRKSGEWSQWKLGSWEGKKSKVNISGIMWL